MATSTAPRKAYQDEQGIERASKQQDNGPADKVAKKSPFVAHLIRMNERFATEGGNQLSAGITYFSVLALFPLTMLLFAGMGFFLANRPEMIEQIRVQLENNLGGEIGGVMSQLIDSAIAQRGAVAGIGLLTTLWSGLGWMNNLRVGISAMWKLDANEGGNFIVKKLWDLLGLIGLILLFILAFAVTAIGASSFTSDLMDYFGLGNFPGARFVVWLVGLAVGIFANFLVMAWLVIFMPRTKVPWRSGLKGALLGAFAFELIKQFATVIVSSATNNPAGAIFGPIIALMVVLYLIWRVVLYVSAWTATTEESLAMQKTEVPEPAVINVRAAAATQTKPVKGTAIGVGAALGALGVGLVSLLTRD
ncbi:YihY/virulence factor BrkB family protein [Corynebacterium sanguinis]|uniref:YhjD/YihY/BrkB family envelope integrity protein n=1 Tax=Corynebacterium sanguinis TaxID=2594913 RepID=UPI0011A8644F|nr:YhjD/YihY/BrkB family envelope integrity protein [Corynebacterium sanguinis]MCT1462946.1 YihY/virulence factor BrkB family protein [Corynebacterium sanguinis]MCT1498653.1 YihY/virulence factor BrkB family protein [Corynebacterium sanguinis]MCT1882100.1 YihY/virulence factor BrkB family protein [Corynebacterium sanguinis]MCT2329430.1 YihY/virulence factor BrkB family protein [Corynebacterium sanguinis]MDN8621567.1 YhjD/YihY/BrkB family envelope integrity protein [Corynebacterium sanguinis]